MASTLLSSCSRLSMSFLPEMLNLAFDRAVNRRGATRLSGDVSLRRNRTVTPRTVPRKRRIPRLTGDLLGLVGMTNVELTAVITLVGDDQVTGLAALLLCSGFGAPPAWIRDLSVASSDRRVSPHTIDRHGEPPCPKLCLNYASFAKVSTASNQLIDSIELE
jgi:hypothetical protein